MCWIKLAAYLSVFQCKSFIVSYIPLVAIIQLRHLYL